MLLQTVCSFIVVSVTLMYEAARGANFMVNIVLRVILICGSLHILCMLWELLEDFELLLDLFYMLLYVRKLASNLSHCIMYRTYMMFRSL